MIIGALIGADTCAMARSLVAGGCNAMRVDSWSGKRGGKRERERERETEKKAQIAEDNTTHTSLLAGREGNASAGALPWIGGSGRGDAKWSWQREDPGEEA